MGRPTGIILLRSSCCAHRQRWKIFGRSPTMTNTPFATNYNGTEGQKWPSNASRIKPAGTVSCPCRDLGAQTGRWGKELSSPKPKVLTPT